MYTLKAYGDNTLWNVTPSDNPIGPTDVLVRNTSTSTTAYFYIPRYEAEAVVTGNFQIPAGAIDASGITGSMTSRRFLIDGITLQTEEWSNPIDAARWDYAYELETLNGDDWFEGSSTRNGRDFVQGLGGNDTFQGYGDDSYGDSFFGGAGIDQSIYRGARDGYVIESTSDIWDHRTGTEPRLTGWRITDQTANRDGIDNLVEVERAIFSDGALGFDIEKWDNAGSAYRLYKAAFDRAPDESGLGYWIDVLDDGGSLQLAASGFINSAEFQSLYGANPSDTLFLTKLYNNVLDRDPDEGGLNYWIGQLNGGMSRESALINFSESNENVSNVAALIENGIQYQPWLG
jgi:Domain of unknown function (DUF4214)